MSRTFLLMSTAVLMILPGAVSVALASNTNEAYIDQVGVSNQNTQTQVGSFNYSKNIEHGAFNVIVTSQNGIGNHAEASVPTVGLPSGDNNVIRQTVKGNNNRTIAAFSE